MVCFDEEISPLIESYSNGLGKHWRRYEKCFLHAIARVSVAGVGTTVRCWSALLETPNDSLNFCRWFSSHPHGLNFWLACHSDFDLVYKLTSHCDKIRWLHFPKYVLDQATWEIGPLWPGEKHVQMKSQGRHTLIIRQEYPLQTSSSDLNACQVKLNFRPVRLGQSLISSPWNSFSRTFLAQTQGGLPWYQRRFRCKQFTLCPPLA